MSPLVDHQPTATVRDPSDRASLVDIRVRTDDPERIARACRARALVLEREGCTAQAAQLRQIAHAATVSPREPQPHPATAGGPP